MGSFAHPMHYFAAAGENDDFVIAVINFQLNQYDWKLLCYLFGFHQCFTIFLPMFHQGFTTASLVSHLCLKSVFEVFKVFQKCFKIVCLSSQLPEHKEGMGGD